jgi:hypothetical protein
MIEEYDLSFLNVENIKKVLLDIKTDVHGLIIEGSSSYNVGMPVLMQPKLKALNSIIRQYLNLYCTTYNIPKLKFINSWFNISNPGNKLKAHKHEESVVSGAFYISGKSPLIFPNKHINPHPGLLVIFSSDLIHFTEEEQEERIVISFNTDKE